MTVEAARPLHIGGDTCRPFKPHHLLITRGGNRRTMRAQRTWVMGVGRLLCLPFPAVLSALLAACTGSPSGPTELLDIRGSWSRGPFTWTWSERDTYDLLALASSARCEGSLVITSQDGSSFGGRYVIDNCGAEGSSGAVLDGHARRDAWWWSLTSRACGSRGQNRVTLDAAEGMPLSSPEA